MAITWMNDKAEDMLLYGPDSALLNNIGVLVKTFSVPLSSYVYKVTLKKLKPATFYYYKVGSKENGWSAEYRFRTGPKAGSEEKFTVGIWSDTQNNHSNIEFAHTDTIVQELVKNSFLFTLHNGDIVENGSVIKSWKNFFNITQAVNASFPFMSVTGNHDVVNSDTSVSFQKPFPVYYDLFNLPSDQLNYSYDYGNTHFIAINSGYAQGAEKKGRVLFEEDSEEYRWLETDLKAARKNRKIKWIILYCHYPLYSWGVSQIPTWQGHIKPLVDKYEVDLCLAGHRHVYERHKAIRNTTIFEQKDPHVYDHPKGTVYITNGSCGGSLQGPGGMQLPSMLFTPNEKIFTFAMMEVEGKSLRYTVYDNKGNVVDHCEIIK